MKVILMVIDGFGVGEMPDAHEFGDSGSNTYGNIKKHINMHLPNLKSLGLDGIMGHECNALGAYGKLSEMVKAKDTTAGHWEMSGIVITKPFVTFPSGIPQKLVSKLEEVWGRKTLSNQVASGTEVINRFGDLHLQTGSPIVYTSADSVLQVACHSSVMSHQELYKLCEQAREICSGEFEVGRVIARPFDGVSGNYQRTIFRKDYAVLPPQNMLTKLVANGFETVGVGKISDIFAGVGITQSHADKGNQAQLEKTIKLMQQPFDGLLFANYLDTDMHYGHRNDVAGYAKCLEQFDGYLGKILALLGKDDLLIVTGDHGNDPTTPSTDHSREYVPVMLVGKGIKPNTNIGIKHGFDTIAQTVLNYFNIESGKKSLMKEIAL